MAVTCAGSFEIGSCMQPSPDAPGFPQPAIVIGRHQVLLLLPDCLIDREPLGIPGDPLERGRFQ